MRNSSMCCVVLLILGWVYSQTLVAQEGVNVTLDEIIARSGEAMGYGEGFQELKKLRFQLHSDGKDGVTNWEISRPNLVRKEWDRGVVLVSDGDRAAFLAGPRDDNGDLKGPHMIPEEDWHHFEMDIALYIPAYFEYPAELVETTEYEGHSVHRISVKLPLGGMVIYLVDGKTFLPVNIRLPSWKYEIEPENWIEVDGFKVYRTARSPSHPDHGSTLENVEVNPELNPARFAIPRDLSEH